MCKWLAQLKDKNLLIRLGLSTNFKLTFKDVKSNIAKHSILKVGRLHSLKGENRKQLILL